MAEPAALPHPGVTDAEAAVRRALQQLAPLVETVERGQASTPLGDALAALPSAALDAPLLVLGLDAASLEAGLAWLRDTAPGAPTPAEPPSGSLAPAPPAPAAGWQEAALGDGRGARRLLCAADLASLTALPSLGRDLADVSAAVVAGPAELSLSPEAQALLQDLVDAAGGGLALVLGPRADGATPEPGWWQAPTKGPPWTVLHVEAGKPPLRPAWLDRRPTSEARAPALSLAARRLRVVAECLSERAAQETRLLGAKRLQAQRAARHAEGRGGEGEDRAALDTLRQALTQGAESVADDVQQRLKAVLSPGGPLAHAVREAVDGLGRADLTEERRGRVLVYELHETVRLRLLEALRTAVKAQVVAAAGLVAEGLTRVHGSLRPTLAALGRQARDVAVPESLAAEALWKRVRGSLQVPFEFRAERPQRTFWHRLGEGRKAMFALMMVASTLGMIFVINVRALLATVFGPLMGLLLVFGVVRTYRTWAQEEQEFFAHETLRLRQAAKTVMESAAAQTVRDLEAGVVEELAEAARAYQADLDASLRGDAEARRAAVESTRREIQERLRLLDQRARDLGSLAQGAARTAQAVGEAETAARRAFASVVGARGAGA